MQLLSCSEVKVTWKNWDVFQDPIKTHEMLYVNIIA